MACEDKIRSTAEKVFNDADKDGTGSLSRDELMPVVKQIGFNVPESSIKKWFDSVDPNGDKQISLDEFLDIILSQPQEELSDAALRSRFKEVDEDQSGSISRDEMNDVLQEMGISSDLIEKYIDMADTNKDDKICYEEFLRVHKS